MHETYPAIVKKAVEKDARIYRGDETRINRQAYNVKGYSPKGKTSETASYYDDVLHRKKFHFDE